MANTRKKNKRQIKENCQKKYLKTWGDRLMTNHKDLIILKSVARVYEPAKRKNLPFLFFNPSKTKAYFLAAPCKAL